ncbi:MAG: hypothetical protein M1819_000478 [Sarea resinae]|nr:MAG: hypothetical protein M1819_000478 [Sarea resinae]
MEISFYWTTSSQIDWSATGKFIDDLAGMKVLLSGTFSLIVVYALLIIVARAITPFVYDAIGNYLRLTAQSFKCQLRCFERRELSLFLFDHGENMEAGTILHTITEYSYGARHALRGRFLVVIVYLLMLAVYTRQTDRPYEHLCGSLPFTLIGDTDSNDGEFCAEVDDLGRRPFPYELFATPDVLDEAKGCPREWAPWEFASGHKAPLEPVDWLPDEPVPGFQRWYNRNHSADAFYYNPRWDPLRIPNTQAPILPALQEAFGNHDVTIRNVILITLESTRKDVFPLKNSSRMHEVIQRSHEPAEDLDVYRLLANFSRTSELITGEFSGFDHTDNARDLPLGTWKNLSDAVGGLNVQSAITSSTYTLKNLLTSHCGVGSLPVDFAKEATQDIYQPCLPQVLELFNLQKRSNYSNGNQSAENLLMQMWSTAFVQSVTDQYDDQETIIHKVGFAESVARAQIRASKSKHYPPTEAEAHYFGYPETQAKPYMRDIIVKARDSGRRLFLSHMTSSTHHPWVLPSSTQSQEYMGNRGWSDHSDLNNYLNTVKYSDGWLAEIMDMLEETGAINETLVVVTGDHGFAFREDDSSFTTYNGGHVSNFKVPLVFYHPLLPRLHLTAQASTMSVLPTILDLLVSSGSLDSADQNVAKHLLGEYEGQSLVREYQATYKGRKAWHVSLINPGGAFLAISAAALPFRLIMPLCHTAMLRFTDLSNNADEHVKLEAWSIEGLSTSVAAIYGVDAAQWTIEAKAVGTWWFWETKRLWGFGSSSRQNITDEWVGHHDDEPVDPSSE